MMRQGADRAIPQAVAPSKLAERTRSGAQQDHRAGSIVDEYAEWLLALPSVDVAVSKSTKTGDQDELVSKAGNGQGKNTPAMSSKD